MISRNAGPRNGPRDGATALGADATRPVLFRVLSSPGLPLAGAGALAVAVGAFRVPFTGAAAGVPAGVLRLDDALVDEVRLTPGKVIVWCAFQREMDDVVRALRSFGG